jgi:hypothetical protein
VHTLEYDIEIERGASFYLALIYQEADGTPIDLTGFTAGMQVRSAVGGHLLADLSTANSMIKLGELQTGSIEARLPIAMSRKLAQAEGVYDLFIYSPDGSESYKLIKGAAIIHGSVTQ